MKNFFIICFLPLAIFLFITDGYTQVPVKSRPSPLAMTTARYKDTYIKITYCQPHKNGRDIFGKLVPYGKVWRLGANEATEITLTKDILINNALLKAGTYSMFAIPSTEQWTIIINSDVGLWGSYNYNQAKDVLRFDARVQQNNEVFEPFTIRIDARNDLAELLFYWDQVKIIIPVKFLQ